MRFVYLLQRIFKKVFWIPNTVSEGHADSTQLNELKHELAIVRSLLTDQFINISHSIEINPLNKNEFKAFSQNGEDGILMEILKNLGIQSGFFVEFGVQDGLETNTTLMLFRGWQGLWIEADEYLYSQIVSNLHIPITSGKLRILNDFVNTKNFESILLSQDVPRDFDVLSIDIDSNDYWVWQSLTEFYPKVVIIEYNAFFPPDINWVMDYDEKRVWDSTIYFGASLKSLYELGLAKGYTLVCCSSTGVNAFFVRNDLLNDNFTILSLKNIYKPINYHLSRKMPILKKVKNVY